MALVLVLGCRPDGATPDEAVIPDGAVIVCHSKDTCPPDHVCRESIGRCVRATSDAEPPRLVGTGRITPSIGRLGTRVLVTFDTNEPLASPPTVYADMCTGSFQMSRQSGTETNQQYALDVTTETPEGLARVFTDLVDQDGNQALGLSVGTFAVDRTPPALLGQPSVTRFRLPRFRHVRRRDRPIAAKRRRLRRGPGGPDQLHRDGAARQPARGDGG